MAAVSNRTGTVNNGDRLKVLEHGRRFLRVQTEKGELGWIDEKVVATQDVFDGFAEVKKAHQGDPAVASAVVRDEVYMHLKPGRDTDKLFRLAEGEKLQLLSRATLQKANSGPPMRARATAAPVATTPAKPAAVLAKGATGAKADEAPLPPPMEDWWLVRDSQGHTGWLLSRMMDVDAPDSLTRYSEGQRIVGAYILNKVNDPDAPQDDKNIPQYVAVMSPYKAGLPYDFDQVRLFIWNVKKHRYETGFREKNVEGYLPIEIAEIKDPTEKGTLGMMTLPAFRYRVLSADSAAVVPDAATGAISPGKTFVKTYRLEGNITHRVLGAGEIPPEEAHPVPPDEKKKGKHRR
ncbi:SH3 domain-containing protein [Granulicella arctica]|uniref:SH3 domain-containing protein n=1 Tax=Granulicella arctica TaxID=940613 RepID=UPI0021DF50F1|nr:SH3 domain-containing protein [Granulicella arctica]